MPEVLLGVLLLVAPGIWAALRARAEMGGVGRGVSRATFGAAFVSFFGQTACTVLAALRGAWALPWPRGAALWAGAAIGLIGVAIYLSGRVRFRSFRLAWGLTTERLVTDGVYRFTRNPQLIGWMLMEFGAAVMGRSGAALVLAILFVPACAVCIKLEERVLLARFGEEYRRFIEGTPRYLGWAGQREHEARPDQATTASA
jgi:protein-S-isoprenylcysteine O-methyltransferase Ste14